MSDRYPREKSRKASKRAAPDPPASETDQQRARLDSELREVQMAFAIEVIPGIEDFRAYMGEQNRRLDVTKYLDHVEGPQIVVQIARADGRITATLIAEVTPAGIRPYWDVQSTGRVTTHWIARQPGGVSDLTREHVLQKLIELYTTDFS